MLVVDPTATEGAVAVTGASSTIPRSAESSVVEVAAREVAMDDALTAAEGATRMEASTWMLAAETESATSAGEMVAPEVRVSRVASRTLKRLLSKASIVPAMVKVAVTRGHVCFGGGGGRGGAGGGKGEGGEGEGGGG